MTLVINYEVSLWERKRTPDGLHCRKLSRIVASREVTEQEARDYFQRNKRILPKKKP